MNIRKNILYLMIIITILSGSSLKVRAVNEDGLGERIITPVKKDKNDLGERPSPTPQPTPQPKPNPVPQPKPTPQSKPTPQPAPKKPKVNLKEELEAKKRAEEEAKKKAEEEAEKKRLAEEEAKRKAEEEAEKKRVEEEKKRNSINKIDLKITRDKEKNTEFESPYKDIKTKIYDPVYVSEDNIYSQQVDIYDTNTMIFSNMMGLFFSKSVDGNSPDYPVDRTPYDKLSPILKTNGYSYQAITRAEYVSALASLIKSKDDLREYKDYDFFDSYDTAFQYKVPFMSPEILNPYSPVIFGSWDPLTTYDFIKSMEKMYDKYTTLSKPMKDMRLFNIRYKYSDNYYITKSNVSNEIIKLTGLLKESIKQKDKEEKENIGKFDINKDIAAIKSKDLNIELYDRDELIDSIKNIDTKLFYSLLENYEYSNDTPKDSLPMTIITENKGNCNAITYFILEWLNYHYPTDRYDYKITTVKMENDKNHIALMLNVKGDLVAIDMVNSRTSSLENLKSLKLTERI